MLAYAGPGYLCLWVTWTLAIGRRISGGQIRLCAAKRHPVVQRHGRFDAINSVSDWGCYGRDWHRHAATILVHAHPLAVGFV